MAIRPGPACSQHTCCTPAPSLAVLTSPCALPTAARRPQVGCGTTELGDRPWLPQPVEGYFSRRIRCAGRGGCGTRSASVGVGCAGGACCKRASSHALAVPTLGATAGPPSWLGAAFCRSHVSPACSRALPSAASPPSPPCMPSPPAPHPTPTHHHTHTHTREAACSDADFEAGKRQAAQEGVTLRDKEHLHYYQEFRWAGGWADRVRASMRRDRAGAPGRPGCPDAALRALASAPAGGSSPKAASRASRATAATPAPPAAGS